MRWPVRGEFRISRSALTEIQTVIVELSQNGITGRGECRPYARYDETPESVIEIIESIRSDIEFGLSAEDLQRLLPPGAARNAVDCALWDLRARTQRRSVSDLLEMPAPQPRETAYTLSLDAPEKMAMAAKDLPQYSLLKLKIDADQGAAACKAVLKARPDAKLIIDANEAFTPQNITDLLDELQHPNIALIEQPLPAGLDDFGSIDIDRYPPICADESLHTADDLERLWAAGYRAVNVKLDKCGGLTAARALMGSARERGFLVMAGCMVASSLAMAPMIYLESLADFIDLDGPLLLAKDLPNGIEYEDAEMNPPKPALWGF